MTLVDVATVGPITAATKLWMLDGALRLTVVVKATFSFQPDAAMRLDQPQPVVEHEQLDNAGKVAWPSELAPYQANAGVVVVGHGGSPGAHLAIQRKRRRVVDKRAAAGASAPFAAVASNDPQRRGRLSENQRGTLDDPIAILQGPIDWAYFQCAPSDQQLDFFDGDEWIVLEHVSSKLPLLLSQLPQVTARVRANVGGKVTSAIDVLNADLLILDATQQRCSLCFRGHLALPSADALAELRLTAGLSSHGAAIVWPDAMAAAAVTENTNATRTMAPANVPPAAALPFVAGPASPAPSPATSSSARLDTGTLMVPPASKVSPWAADAPNPTAPNPTAANTAAPFAATATATAAAAPPTPMSLAIAAAPTTDLAAAGTVAEGLGPIPLETSSATAEHPQPQAAAAAKTSSPPTTSLKPARPPRSDQSSRMRARALTSLLTTDEGELDWFIRHNLKAGSQLQHADLLRIRTILEVLSDAFVHSDEEEAKRITMAWELLSKCDVQTKCPNPVETK